MKVVNWMMTKIISSNGDLVIKNLFNKYIKFFKKEKKNIEEK